MEAAVSYIVNTNVPWTLRRVECILLLVVGVVYVVGQSARTLGRRKEKRVVASDEQGTIAQVLGLDQLLRRDVHPVNFDGFRRPQLLVATSHRNSARAFHGPPYLDPAAQPRRVEEVVGGPVHHPHDLSAEYDLPLNRRPAVEVERVDRAVVAHGVEQRPAVTVVEEGAVAAVRFVRRSLYPGPVRVARPREGELAARPVDEHDDAVATAGRRVGRDERPEVEEVGEVGPVQGLSMHMQRPVVRVNQVLVGDDGAGVDVSHEPHLLDGAHRGEGLDPVSGDRVDERRILACSSAVTSHPYVGSAQPEIPQDGSAARERDGVRSAVRDML